MAKGAYYIRIGLPPRVVSGDRLALSCCGLTVIFIVAAHIQCLVIGVVLVRIVDCLMFSLSYVRPWGLFSNRLSGPLTWYLVSHDGLLIMLPLPPISADALWDSIRFQILIATVLGSQYFSHWYDNTGQCGL